MTGPANNAPLRRWEYRYLGEERFPDGLSALEIEHFFTLDEQELVKVRERRSPLNRIALAPQAGFLKMTGNTLNSVERIPADILAHLGRQLDCEPPRIASIRAFYARRRRTLFERHASALRLLGRGELTPHAERGLVAYLRREAAAVFDPADLMASVRSWLVGHHYLLLRERDVRRHVAAARRHHEQALFKVAAAAVPSQREAWVPRLLEIAGGGEISCLEWLGAVPSSKAAKGLEEQAEKVSFLRELGAARLVLPDLPLAGLQHFSRRMTSRKPAALARIKDPHRTIEIACFLRLTMLRITDAGLTLLDHRLTEAFAALDALAASSASTLPEGHAQPFGASWQGLIDQPDRAAALGCFRAATLMALKRALRNRSVSVAHSLSHQAPEDRLIPLKLWLHARAPHCQPVGPRPVRLGRHDEPGGDALSLVGPARSAAADLRGRNLRPCA